ncbi:hypothetical protein BJX63DRAFT_55359 [Aspergillus granulosus]|uniref:Reticulon-like protein n=1 Tax=Aspergillus granulosus TaxID=176169 RepID=A0ABR4GXN9_9EURO
MGALSNLYRILAIPLLTSWSLTALSFVALDVLDSNRSFIEPIASISLLTYLVCRLLVFLQPATQNAHRDENASSIAHMLTTGYRKSPLNALISLAFAAFWLYELLVKTFFMFLITIFGGAFATALYTDAFVKEDVGSTETMYDHDDAAPGAESTALAEFDELKAKMGVDPSAVLKMIPPKLLVYVVAIVWLNFATLGLYVIRHAWRSLRVVFGASGEDIIKDIKKMASSEEVAEKST